MDVGRGSGRDDVVEYEPVIGLEIHVQLSTRTKMFCGCELSFGEPPNTRTCPVCLGLPGALPVANAKAIHFGLMIGMALESELAPRSIFHRKNYFYPDLPKGYQISQYDEPLCRGGRLADVRVHRVHLEEDAAKLVHVGESGRIHASDASIVDFNRGGTPLAEIVTEPDVRSAEQAGEWLRLLRVTLGRLGVSDVNMEEGSLRCDANISVRPAGSDEMGTKTELKNMNSFRFIERGIKAEVIRQEKLLARGEKVVQETLHFDPSSGRITTLRSKEEAHDYRYFPEPDLVPIAVSEEMLDTARASMPELPLARAERFEHDPSYMLDTEVAKTLAFRTDLGDFLELRRPESPDEARVRANLIINELAPRVGTDVPLADSMVTPDAVVTISGALMRKEISIGGARQAFDILVEEGGDADAIIEREGLMSAEGGDELAAVVEAAIAANEDAAQKIKAGNPKAIGPIVGYVMRETQGRADGGEVTRLVHEQLGV